MDDKLTRIKERADEMLKGHNGVYLEKQLYKKLKRKFPDLKRAEFNGVLDELLKQDYVMERGLIRPKAKETKRTSEKFADDAKPGKGTSDTQRIPDKRL